MKFHQLNIGEGFIYQGEAYRKISPLIGSHEISGEQKMFRRADPVQPDLAGSAGNEQAPARENHFGKEQVSELLSQLKQECDELLSEHLSESPSLELARHRLEQAFSKIINKL